MEVTSSSVDHIEYDAQGSCFTASVRTKDSVDIAFFDIEREVFNGSHMAKLLGKVVDRKDSFQGEEILIGLLLDECMDKLLHKHP